MTSTISHLHLARVTLEARTPISSASGGAETVHDMALARDSNGLPRLQGASIQGVLRSLWPERGKAESVFGYQRGSAGAAGRLMISDAVTHDRNDEAVLPFALAADEVLRLLAQDAPLRRDHVRLSGRSVVEGEGKFERLAAPRGARFSFELALWGNDEDVKILEAAIDLMGDERFRLGGATGRGYGAVDVLRAATWSASLKKTAGDTVRQVRRRRLSDQGSPFTPHSPRASVAPGEVVRLDLTPVGPWRIGQDGPSRALGAAGAPPMANPREAAPDSIPLREPSIVWPGGKGQVQPADGGAYIIPGGGVKGALAHRALFHWNRLRENWAASVEDVGKHGRRPAELVAIFGAERDGGKGRPGQGQAGRLFIDDTLVEIQDVRAAVFDHNSIDRFTGGVRNRILFAEEVAIGGKIGLTLRLLERRGGGLYDETAIAAVNEAVKDLFTGRLALGAKSLGYCLGEGAPPAFAGSGASAATERAA